MKWTVVWVSAALDDLARAWTDAPDRQAVADASDAIDAQLLRHPYAVGESRAGAERILIVPPLVALYDIANPDRLVTVRAVWRTR